MGILLRVANKESESDRVILGTDVFKISLLQSSMRRRCSCQARNPDPVNDVEHANLDERFWSFASLNFCWGNKQRQKQSTEIHAELMTRIFIIARSSPERRETVKNDRGGM